MNHQDVLPKYLVLCKKNIKGKACGHKNMKRKVSLTPEKHFIN